MANIRLQLANIRDEVAIKFEVANILSQLAIKSGNDDYLASSEDYLMASDD